MIFLVVVMGIIFVVLPEELDKYCPDVSVGIWLGIALVGGIVCYVAEWWLERRGL